LTETSGTGPVAAVHANATAMHIWVLPQYNVNQIAENLIMNCTMQYNRINPA